MKGSRSAERKLTAVFAAVCLITGIAIYLLFRDRHHLVFTLVDTLGFGPAVDALRASCRGIRLSEFCLFSLPDGLWSTSYILAIHSLWINAPRRSRLLWASVIPFIGAASECMQLLSLLPGQFDVADLVCYLLPMLIYCILTHYIKT